MTRQQRRYLARQAAKVEAYKPQKFRRARAEDNAITPLEISLAKGALMTGPRAQSPSWKAIRKMVGNLRNHASLGLQMPLRHVRNSYRAWPKGLGKDLEPINA